MGRFTAASTHLTAPGSGRCLHRCTLVLCPCIAAGGGTEYEQGTASEGYDRGTALIHNRAGYGKGTDGGTKTIGGVRQSGIAPHKKSIGSLIKAHFQYNAINTIIIFIIIFSNLFYVMIDVNSSSNVKSLPKISSTEGAKMENVWKCPKV